MAGAHYGENRGDCRVSRRQGGISYPGAVWSVRMDKRTEVFTAFTENHLLEQRGRLLSLPVASCLSVWVNEGKSFLYYRVLLAVIDMHVIPGRESKEVRRMASCSSLIQ